MHKTAFTSILICCAYLLSGQGFNMSLEGSWDNSNYEFNDCWGYTDASGNEYAIMGSRTKVIFFDVTTPTAPSLLAEFTGAFPGIAGANSIWRDFKTYDRYAYAVADQGNEGLMVFDLSDIHNGNISKVNQLNNQFNKAHNIFIDVPQGKLYIIGSNTQSDGLIVYDIAEDPSNPVLLASVSLSMFGGYLHDAYVYDNIVYGSSGNDGLFIIDMSTPTAPVFKSFDESIAAGYNHSGWPFDNGNKMLVAEEVPTGLKLGIFDISDLNEISHISSFRDPINTTGTGFTTYHNPYMVGDLAVISSYQDGITIMDLTDTSAPFRAAHYDTFANTNYAGYSGCWGAYPYFPSGTIVGSDISTGLYVLSTSLSMTNTCNNGVKDDFEIDVDCGGFCNTCECSAPTDMVFSNAAASNIQIDWTAVNTAVGYEVRYRETGTSSWVASATSTNMLTLSGLSTNTEYDFQIRADCGSRLTPYATAVVFEIGDCLNQATYTNSQGSGTYETANFIRSAARLSANSNVKYLTGDSILLNQNFTVGSNIEFIAEVNRPCGEAPFAGQEEIAKYVNLEPAVPSEKYTLVENHEAGLFYIISNDKQRSPYTIEILDINGDILKQSIKLQTQSFVKYIGVDKQHSVRIKEGDQMYVIDLNVKRVK